MDFLERLNKEMDQCSTANFNKPIARRMSSNLLEYGFGNSLNLRCNQKVINFDEQQWTFKHIILPI